MPALYLRFEGRGTFFLDEGKVLPTERVPAKTLEVESELLSSRTNVVPQNRPVVQGFAVLVEHVIVGGGI